MLSLTIRAAQFIASWAAAVVAPALLALSWQAQAHASLRSGAVLWLGGGGTLILLWTLSSGIRRSVAFRERVLIVGTHPLVATLIDEIEEHPERPFTVIGVIDDVPDARTGVISLRLGSLDRLGDIIDATQPARIVLAMADPHVPIPAEPLLDARMRGVAVEEGASFLERLTGKLAIEALTPTSLILSDGFRHSDFVNADVSMVFVRLVSLLCALAALVLLLPVLAAIGLAIRLDSPGPILFIQRRVGWGGRPFGLVKFRTMHAQVGPRSEWVRDNDDRITAIGRWMRRFRLDELPQFVNVLRGEMNLVGPRPHPVSNYKLFLDRIPYYALRSAVRPGITGWAQVRYGYANGLHEETEKMRYDLYYIKHRSLWLDARILGETMTVVFGDHSTHASVRHAPVNYWHDTRRGTRQPGA
jgi:exopolysaccharide biosynthesis polyprenyl glycosylphosphotransferase